MKIKYTAIAITVICQMWGTAASADPDPEGDWQLGMIHDPSDAQLRVEERGRVYIYDGVYDTEVKLAMDTQFNRLDNMMFVRTKVATPEGETETEDDGCD